MMPPFKRTTTKFTGDADCNGRDMSLYCGDEVEIVARAPGMDEDDDIYSIRVNGKTFRVEGDDLNPRPDAPATNEEFMSHLMKWCDTPMVHAFIFEAINKYAAAVLADPERTREQMAGGLIGAQTWMDSAKQARDAVNAHLNGGR